MTSRVVWRGVTVDARTADMLTEVAAHTGSIYVRPTQGSFRGGATAASAGTHDGCGAVDIITGTPEQMRKIVWEARRVGFAAWLRTPQQSNWPYHVHAIAIQPGGKNDRGCLSPGAHAQVVDYYNGRNGLARHDPDDGPRRFVGTTWETYQHNRPHPPRHEDWFTMASKKDLEDVIDSRLDDIAAAVWKQAIQHADRPRQAGWLLRKIHTLASSGPADQATAQHINSE